MTRKCNRCKRQLSLELFNWLSGKSRPMLPVGVCDYCLGIKQEPSVDEADNVEEQAEESETSEGA